VIERPEVVEGVAFDPLAAILESVQSGVAARRVEAFRGDFDPVPALGTGLERVQPERPGVAEDVEHAAAASVRLQGARLKR